MSATCARRSSPGSRRGRRTAGSSCAWRTSIESRHRSSTSAGNSPTWPRSASTGTATSFVRANGSSATARRSRSSSERGLVYPCYCTRREIRREIEAAASAPHGELPSDGYPGTCRDLTRAERSEREALGRPAALRLRTEHEQIEFVDLLAGVYRGPVDDVVLQRGDGVPAYNLAVVVDDAAQGVTQVVRGDDLLSSTPRQVLLQRLLGLPTPEYLHVPLVLGPDGERLAKRHGAVTLSQLAERRGQRRRCRRLAGHVARTRRAGERVGARGLIGRFEPTKRAETCGHDDRPPAGVSLQHEACRGARKIEGRRG